jgi:hypothetical protein
MKRRNPGRSRMSTAKRFGNRRSPQTNGPPASVLVYRGPSLLRTGVVPEIREVSLRAFLTISTAGAAITDFVFQSNNVRTLGADFSSWASLYREYRVLSLRADYTPAYENSLNTAQALATGTAVWTTVIDRDDASPTAGIANVISNDSLRQFSITRRWFRNAKMNSPGEGEFVINTADPVQYFTIKCNIGVAAPTSVAWGQIVTTWLVQFRTRV